MKKCDATVDPNCKEIDYIPLIKDIVHYFIVSVTVVVVAIPEGLPLAVTISLAYSVSQMQKEQNLVRRLDAAETMGGANVICTDKTGTLTQNKMTVKGLYTEDRVHIDDIDTVRFDQIHCNYLIAEGVAYNSSAHIETNKTTKKPEAVGNATEQGLLRYLMQHEVPHLENTMNDKAQHIVCQIPFDSLRKKGLTVIRHPQTPGVIRVFAKGAPDFMLKDCTSYFGADGNQLQLSQDKKDEIVNNIIRNSFGKKALRTLLIAYKDLTEDQYQTLKSQNNNFEHEEDKAILETDLTMLCIFGL